MGVFVAAHLCTTYLDIFVTHTFGTWERGWGTLDPPNLLFLWLVVTLGIFMAELTIAVKYKIALCDSFAGIKARSRFLTG